MKTHLVLSSMVGTALLAACSAGVNVPPIQTEFGSSGNTALSGSNGGGGGGNGGVPVPNYGEETSSSSSSGRGGSNGSSQGGGSAGDTKSCSAVKACCDSQTDESLKAQCNAAHQAAGDDADTCNSIYQSLQRGGYCS